MVGYMVLGQGVLGGRRILEAKGEVYLYGLGDLDTKALDTEVGSEAHSGQ